ncbi:MAG: methylated-DNA--[protein]-cysteine S-methyltransferase [Phycisphaerales bacterium]
MENSDFMRPWVLEWYHALVAAGLSKSGRIFSSPLGDLELVADGAVLRSLQFVGSAPAGAAIVKSPLLEQVEHELHEYFQGRRQSFDFATDPAGTEFQRRVWDELRRIPYAQTISYAELARRVGSANGFRAVGAANGANPIAIAIPCHRVINSDGALGGYSGDLWRKRWLLEHERRVAGMPPLDLFAVKTPVRVAQD